jgi:Holliday junction resolvasome RuvABC endonuclease subunit
MKTKASSVMGIDASTTSIAFCVLEGTRLVKFGEIQFKGDTIYSRMLDAKRKVRALRREFDVEFIAIESAVMVRSAAVAIKMAYVFGAIMSELLENGSEVVEVTPIAWQSFIGNKNFTSVEKENIKKDFPGKTKTWYSNKTRELRKQKTMNFFNKEFGITVKSDNVSDSIGVAWYAANKLTEKR